MKKKPERKAVWESFNPQRNDVGLWEINLVAPNITAGVRVMTRTEAMTEKMASAIRDLLNREGM